MTGGQLNGSPEKIVGVPLPTASRVVKVSQERLRSWNSLGLIAPIIDGRGLWEFSLDDLVRAQVVRALEELGVHIHRITHEVVERRHLVADPLVELTWAVGGNAVYTKFEDGLWTGGAAPDQGVMIEMVDQTEIRRSTRLALARPSDSAGKTVHRRATHGGKEVFAGTRIPLEAVFSYLRHGLSDQRILDAYPDLTPEDVKEARSRFAA